MPQVKKQRVGRPKGDHRLRFQVLHNPYQKSLWTEAAIKDRRDLQSWIRKTLDDAAERQLRAKP